jgi:hypothetical protein
MKRFILLLLFVPVFTFAETFYSPTWGFFLDLPEGYDFLDGDGRDRFSFGGPGDINFDIIVYNGTFGTMEELTNDINRRLSNRGDVDFFDYHGKQAAIIELNFGDSSGWALCVELAAAGTSMPPMLLALGYGPEDSGLDLLHISALDSISPSAAERYYPGPIIEYSYPRGEMKPVTLAGGINAVIRENDAEAAQVLIEREFIILQYYAETSYWMEAWARYYRLIYRDSYDRVINPVFALVRSWGGYNIIGDEEKREFAKTALTYLQSFQYERNFDGSDFLNLVSSVTENRGDCDSRAMLWAIILSHAEIRSAMMVSPQHSHAMGLADIAGAGARFEYLDIRWLVAETTANIDIGLIAQEQSDPQHWFGIIFD